MFACLTHLSDPCSSDQDRRLPQVNLDVKKKSPTKKVCFLFSVLFLDIDFDGTLSVYPVGSSYPYYYYYGYGSFYAMFFVFFFVSLLFLCGCFFPENYGVVRYVETEGPMRELKEGKEEALYEPPIPHLKEEVIVEQKHDNKWEDN
jgi:hypothetical protein